MIDATRLQERHDVVVAEVTERELVGVASELVELRSAGLVEFVTEPGSDDHQSVRARFSAGEEPREEQRGVVAEMDVVDHDHDRSMAVELVEQSAERCEPVRRRIGQEAVVDVAAELVEHLPPRPQR